jgi:hypothetical protein
MDWADTAAGIPGADRHPLFEVVASWAAFGAALHGEPERARAVLQRVDAAEEAPGARSVVACRAAAVLAFFTGDLDAARTKSDEWVAVARATGDPYEVSQALVMQGNAIQLLDLEASIRTLEEAVQTAREAGIPSALAIALSCLAAGLVLRDPLPPTVAQRAIRLAEEAIEVGTTIGDRTSVGVAIGIKGFIGERRGDWRLQLESCVEAADLALELGSPQQLAPRLGGAAWALAHFGAFESAAILQSASETLWGGRWGIPDIILAQIAEFDTTLLEQLGAERLSELQAHGAALGLAEVVEYLRVEATRVLTTA